MRNFFTIVATLVVMVTIPASGATIGRSEPDRPTKSKFVKQTSGRGAIVRAAANAGIQQARNSPHEWGGGIAGYGKRFGSSFGGHIVKNSIKYPVASLRHEAIGYHP